MITGKVVKKEVDENGNIKISTEYTLTDGTKRIGVTRYNFRGFNAGIVKDDIKHHCETLMKKVHGLKKHPQLLNDIDLSGATYECNELEVILPEIKNRDGILVQAESTIVINDN